MLRETERVALKQYFEEQLKSISAILEYCSANMPRAPEGSNIQKYNQLDKLQYLTRDLDSLSSLILININRSSHFPLQFVGKFLVKFALAKSYCQQINLPIVFNDDKLPPEYPLLGKIYGAIKKLDFLQPYLSDDINNSKKPKTIFNDAMQKRLGGALKIIESKHQDPSYMQESSLFAPAKPEQEAVDPDLEAQLNRMMDDDAQNIEDKLENRVIPADEEQYSFSRKK